MSERGAVAITGANGYLGRVLGDAFAAAGFRVVALQRSVPDGDHIPYTLEDGPAGPLPGDVCAVVHCAYDLRARDQAEIERINLGGTKKLLDMIGDVPMVFISSMSAYAGTQQIYGRAKLACENLVTQRGGTSLRPGLVYGSSGEGMIGALSKVAGLPLVPLLRPDSYQYTVHAADLADCVVSTVQTPPPHRVLGVANPERVLFNDIIRTLREATTTKPLRSVSLPSALLYRALRAGEAAGLRAGFRADSMLGLMHPAHNVAGVEYWADRGIALRGYMQPAAIPSVN